MQCEEQLYSYVNCDNFDHPFKNYLTHQHHCKKRGNKDFNINNKNDNENNVHNDNNDELNAHFLLEINNCIHEIK